MEHQGWTIACSNEQTGKVDFFFKWIISFVFVVSARFSLQQWHSLYLDQPLLSFSFKMYSWEIYFYQIYFLHLNWSLVVGGRDRAEHLHVREQLWANWHKSRGELHVLSFYLRSHQRSGIHANRFQKSIANVSDWWGSNRGAGVQVDFHLKWNLFELSLGLKEYWLHPWWSSHTRAFPPPSAEQVTWHCGSETEDEQGFFGGVSGHASIELHPGETNGM